MILTRQRAAEARDWTRLGLTLNEAKTKRRQARQESFDFLGYTFGPQRYRKDGHGYWGARPSKKSVARRRQKVNEVLGPGHTEPWRKGRDRLKRLLRGWSNYFSYGTRWLAYRAVDHHVATRVRHFLRRRHQVSSRGRQRWAEDVILGPLGVLRLRGVHLGARP